MREPDHVAACFLGYVGEVAVHDPGESVRIPPRLASCSEPLSVLFIFPLFSFSERSSSLAVIPFPRLVEDFTAYPFVKRSRKIV